MKPAGHQNSGRSGLAPLLGAVIGFSVVVNLLMFTGPLFMLQVYDRVLASRSEATLVSLFGLVAVLYAFMGVIDHVRARVAARAGARFQAAADAGLCRLGSRDHGAAAEDAASVRRALSVPQGMAVFDLPWAPVFLLAIFVFHPALGWLAVAGLFVLLGLALGAPLAARRRARRAQHDDAEAEAVARRAQSFGDDIRGLGLERGLEVRWRRLRQSALFGELRVSDITGGIQATGRAFRLFMQSAMLALGAFLVIEGALTPGAMIAASIMLGRALAPVDQVISAWPMLEGARRGWLATQRRLAAAATQRALTVLPRPSPEVSVEGLVVVPPEATRATLLGVSFTVEPGEALGVIGPSGAGKSSLARALTGVWSPHAGRVRLGGAALEQFEPAALSSYVGYLPQDVSLFPGTVAENIARLAEAPDDAEVVRAAKAAGAHDLILRLPKGYDTGIDAAGAGLSGGQRQRVALARALYGRPELLVLDEPNSNLDSPGQEALTAAIGRLKEAGKAVVVMAHRPAAIAQCDRLMILDAGRIRAIGSRDEILRAEIQNHAEATPLMRQSA